MPAPGLKNVPFAHRFSRVMSHAGIDSLAAPSGLVLSAFGGIDNYLAQTRLGVAWHTGPDARATPFPALFADDVQCAQLGCELLEHYADDPAVQLLVDMSDLALDGAAAATQLRKHFTSCRSEISQSLVFEYCFALMDSFVVASDRRIADIALLGLRTLFPLIHFQDAIAGNIRRSVTAGIEYIWEIEDRFTIGDLTLPNPTKGKKTIEELKNDMHRSMGIGLISPIPVLFWAASRYEMLREMVAILLDDGRPLPILLPGAVDRAFVAQRRTRLELDACVLGAVGYSEIATELRALTDRVYPEMHP